MRYKVREKIFAIGDAFTIEDEHGNAAFKVKSKILSFRNRMEMEDASGKDVATMHKKIVAFFETWTVEIAGGPAVKVRRGIKLFGSRFSISGGGEKLDARGSFYDYNFEITRGGRTAAVVSKKFFALSDTYGVEVADGEDPALMMALVIVFDQIFHEERD
ncbi:MAG: LURP-one-related family protein [Sumerlaeia bacterium]